MKRRDFLKAALGGGIASGGLLLGSSTGLLPRKAHAAPGLPAVIVVFQRGGCDGLNTVVPYGDPDYAALRPTIGIAPPDPFDATSAIDLDGFFGLHPSLSPLKQIFDDQRLAVMPSVHYPDASRSHFSSQRYIESGENNNDTDGWLNRLLAATPAGNNLRAVSFGGSLAQSLRGDIPVASFSTINSFNLGLNNTEEQQLVDRVLPIYENEPAVSSSYRQLVHRFGRVLFGSLDSTIGLDPDAYVPENNAMYPNSSYGRRLKDIAYLLKEPSVELEVATVDIGGWDTHSDQGGGEASGRQARGFNQFANGLAALYQDLGPLMDNVIVVTMTEFGRTAKENGSRGTDHGHASSWFAFGGAINGGVYNGPQGWPGLREEDLERGRYLKDTINHRDIMGDILTNHMGVNDLSSLLPGHSYQTTGIFG